MHLDGSPKSSQLLFREGQEEGFQQDIRLRETRCQIVVGPIQGVPAVVCVQTEPCGQLLGGFFVALAQVFDQFGQGR